MEEVSAPAPAEVALVVAQAVSALAEELGKVVAAEAQTVEAE